MSTRNHVVVCDLGRMEYEPAWILQKQVQQRLIAAKRSTPAEVIPHVLLFVEHPPVYTLGKNGDNQHLLVSDEALRQRGATFYHIDRGGDITFHGPGQIVGYPILDLDRFFTDIHRYLRELEGTVIDTLASYGIEGRRVDGRTGVWVGPDELGFERKICAMGIRCSRWVTMHGFALNVATDLSYFDLIVPCGISDRSPTSIEAESGAAVERADVQRELTAQFSRRFGVSITELGGQEARAFLDAYVASSASVGSS